MTKEQVRHNQRICLTFRGLASIVLAVSITTTYYNELGLDQMQVSILQATAAAVGAVADVPLGYLADRIGLRKVMIIGSVAMLLQGIFFVMCENFLQFIFALAATGLYIAALENTCEGVMTLSLKASPEANEEEARVWYQRYLVAQVRAENVVCVIGNVMGGAMVWFGGVVLPYYAQLVVSTLCVITAWRVVDPTRVPQRRTSCRAIRRALRMMLVLRSDIRYMIMLQASYRLFFVLCFWILQPRMKLAGLPVWLYSSAYVYPIGVVLIAGLVERWVSSKSTAPWVLLLVVPYGGALVAGLTTGVFGFVLLMVGIMMESAFVRPLVSAFMYDALPEDTETRNTELSVASAAATALCVLVLPWFGMLVDRTSVGDALVVAAVTCFLFSSCSLLLFHRARP